MAISVSGNSAMRMTPKGGDMAVDENGIGIKVTKVAPRVTPTVKPHGPLFSGSPQVKPAEYTAPTFTP